MYARAGRRAGLNSDTSAGFDPLSAPPPPPAVDPEPEQPATKETATDDGPTWLDEDDAKPSSVAQPTAAASSVVPAASAPPQPVTTPSPVVTGDSKPRVPAYVPPWAKSLPQPVLSTPATSAVPSTPAPAAETPMKALTPLVRAVEVPAPAAPIEMPKALPPVVAATPPPPTAPSVPAPTSVPTGPSFAASATVQQLREKLALLETQERAVVDRCSHLLAKPGLSTSVESRARQTMFEAKRLELTNGIYRAKAAHRDAVDLAMRQRAERLLKIRTESHETRVEKARVTLNNLASQVATADAAVRDLKRELQSTMRNATDTVQPSAEDRAATELSKQIHTLFAGWRQLADSKSISALREATRARLLDVSQAQQRIHDQARADRATALRKYFEQRQEAFSVFRRARRDGRKHAADAFFTSLKNTRERHLKETIAANSSVAVRHERELEEAAAIARAEAKASLERAMSRHRTAAQDEWVSLENQLRRREAAVSEEQAHKRKLFEHDRSALARRNALELQGWSDTAKAAKTPTAISQILAGDLKAQRKRIKETYDTAVIAVKGIDAAKKLPSAFKANLSSRETALETVKQAVQLKAGSLSQQWVAVAASIQQLSDQLARMYEKASVGRSDTNAAQQRLDVVRAAWEKEERGLLNRSELPTADNAHADVIFDIAAQLREVTEKHATLRRERADTYGRSLSTEDELEQAHSEFAKQFFALLGKYDDVASTLAAVEGKRRHLDNEAEDQRLAKASLDQEWREMARNMERVHAATEAMRKDAAVLAAAERRSSMAGPRHTHVDPRGSSALGMPSRRDPSGLGDFSTLIRLPEDSSTGSWSTTRPGATTAPSGSITTPSPDTDN